MHSVAESDVWIALSHCSAKQLLTSCNNVWEGRAKGVVCMVIWHIPKCDKGESLKEVQ